MRFFVPLFATLVCAGAGAQSQPGACALGVAEGVIDIGGVRAKVFNTGALFFGNQSASAYEVPAGSGRSALFASNLWVGGFVDGEFRMAGAASANWEFWPGPLRAGGALPDSTDCTPFDRIWRVSRADIERYYTTGEATSDLEEWPHHLGAPVLDGDGDSDNYDLAAGDQPAVWGDQTLWWVMNDVGNIHTESDTPPIGLEVQVTAYGVAQGPDALRQATFYHYRLINRSDRPLEDAWVAVYSDVEIGDSSDDYVGTDTTLSLGYAYNADNEDGSGEGGTYGEDPPAVGFRLLSTPVSLPDGEDNDEDGEVDELGEQAGLSSTFCHAKNQGFPFTEPINGEQRFHCMQGRWPDGSPITVGGTGIGGPGPVTSYLFPADPVSSAYWSEPCPNQPCGAPNTPFDHRLGVSSGPFRIDAGESQDLVFAIVYGHGSSNLDSIVRLRTAARVVSTASEIGHLEPRRVEGAPAPQLPASIEVWRPAPNPVSSVATFRYGLPAAARVRVAVVDVLGREVAVLEDGAVAAGAHELEIDGRTVPAGVYVVRLWVDGQEAASMPVTVVR